VARRTVGESRSGSGFQPNLEHLAFDSKARLSDLGDVSLRANGGPSKARQDPNERPGATDGNLHGGTRAGGLNNDGTMFKITPGGTLTALFRFCSLTSCAEGS
jgi:uncharacterized repeat protein (TIGR03803 family)